MADRHVSRSRPVAQVQQFSSNSLIELPSDTTQQLACRVSQATIYLPGQRQGQCRVAVTWSASQTYSASTSVPSGACRIIKAYDTFKNYRFEVWDQNFIGDPFKVGSGTAKRFIGVWYQVVTC